MCAACKCRAELTELNESHDSLRSEEREQEAAMQALQDGGLDTVSLMHLEAWSPSQSDSCQLLSSHILSKMVLTTCSCNDSLLLSQEMVLYRTSMDGGILFAAADGSKEGPCRTSIPAVTDG